MGIVASPHAAADDEADAADDDDAIPVAISTDLGSSSLMKSCPRFVSASRGE